MNRYQSRIDKLRPLMKEAGIDAYFINSNCNVSYFTGKKGNDCSLYITQDEAWIITDFRYEEMAQSMSEWLQFYEIGAGKTVYTFIEGRKEKVLGIEKDYLPLNTYLALVELGGRELKPVSGLVESLREIKDQEELDNIAKASKISCQALEQVLKMIKPGISELEIAAELEYQLKKRGADGLAFDTIAITGKKTSMPHGVPGNELVKEGDFITMDFGCKYNGYCSDMTRTVAVGQPTEEMRNVYDIVLKAQMNAIEHIRAGLTGETCDAFARDVIKAAGYGDRFGHSLGHGVGLFVHEGPRYRMGVTTPIPEDSVVSIEPGIYLPGKFGVRIEDLAIVKADGIINLVDFEKKLIIL